MAKFRLFRVRADKNADACFRLHSLPAKNQCKSSSGIKLAKNTSASDKEFLRSQIASLSRPFSSTTLPPQLLTALNASFSRSIKLKVRSQELTLTPLTLCSSRAQRSEKRWTSLAPCGISNGEGGTGGQTRSVKGW